VCIYFVKASMVFKKPSQYRYQGQRYFISPYGPALELLSTNMKTSNEKKKKKKKRRNDVSSIRGTQISEAERIRVIEEGTSLHRPVET